MPETRAPIFSRIVLVAVVLISLAGGFWLGASFLEPVKVPPTPPAKSKVQFDPRADVSKNPVFSGLQPLGPAKVETGELGRLNPFVAPPKETATTTTATSTPATSTPEIVVPPPPIIPELP